MNYGCYKNARNASWHCLIDYKINSLPVKVSRIAKQADITLLKNSAVNLLNNSESGATLMQNDKFTQMNNLPNVVDLRLHTNLAIYF